MQVQHTSEQLGDERPPPAGAGEIPNDARKTDHDSTIPQIPLDHAERLNCRVSAPIQGPTEFNQIEGPALNMAWEQPIPLDSQSDRDIRIKNLEGKQVSKPKAGNKAAKGEQTPKKQKAAGKPAQPKSKKKNGQGAPGPSKKWRTKQKAIDDLAKAAVNAPQAVREQIVGEIQNVMGEMDAQNDQQAAFVEDLDNLLNVIDVPEQEVDPLATAQFGFSYKDPAQGTEREVVRFPRLVIFLNLFITFNIILKVVSWEQIISALLHDFNDRYYILYSENFMEYQWSWQVFFFLQKIAIIAISLMSVLKVIAGLSFLRLVYVSMIRRPEKFFVARVSPWLTWLGFNFPLMKRKKYKISVEQENTTTHPTDDFRSDVMGAVKLKHSNPMLMTVRLKCGVPGYNYAPDSDNYSMPSFEKIKIIRDLFLEFAKILCAHTCRALFMFIRVIVWLLPQTFFSGIYRNTSAEDAKAHVSAAIYNLADDCKKHSVGLLACVLQIVSRVTELLFFYKPYHVAFDRESKLLISRELVSQYAVPMMSMNFDTQEELARRIKRMVVNVQSVNISRYQVSDDIYWNSAEIAILMKRSQVTSASKSRTGFSVLNF